MKQLALKYYNEFYSCSESILMAAIEKGYCSEDLLKIASPFSGGMSSGCLCGAVAGSQIVIGAVFDRDLARLMAKEFMDKFKAKHKATCCRVLSKGLDRNSAERRENCKRLVCDCAEILEEFIKGKVYA